MRIIAFYRITYTPDRLKNKKSLEQLVSRITQCEVRRRVALFGKEKREVGVVRHLGGPAKPPPLASLI